MGKRIVMFDALLTNPGPTAVEQKSAKTADETKPQ